MATHWHVEPGRREPPPAAPPVRRAEPPAVRRMLALQRAAGNAGATRWLQRVRVIEGQTTREDGRPPRGHIAQRGTQTAYWVPFDEERWTSDQGYREMVLAQYVGPPEGPLERIYEETPREFVERTGIRTAYRAIRIRGQSKRDPSDVNKSVSVPPEGGSTGLFPDLDVIPRMAAYQRLTSWPDVPILPTMPAAELSPIQHVSGDNYASRYVSAAVDPDRARFCSLVSFSANSPDSTRVRAVTEWSPVVEIDLTKLGANARIVDLTTAQARARAGFVGASAQAIASLSDADQEILITGVIPPAAVVAVSSAVTVAKEIKQVKDLVDAKLEDFGSSQKLEQFAHFKPLIDERASQAPSIKPSEAPEEKDPFVWVERTVPSISSTSQALAEVVPAPVFKQRRRTDKQRFRTKQADEEKEEPQRQGMKRLREEDED